MTPDQLFVIAIIAPISALAASIVAGAVAALPAILAYMKSRENEKKIKEVHQQLNSRLTEMIEPVRQVAEARGKELGKAEEKQDEAARVAQAGGESSGE